MWPGDKAGGQGVLLDDPGAAGRQKIIASCGDVLYSASRSSAVFTRRGGRGGRAAMREGQQAAKEQEGKN